MSILTPIIDGGKALAEMAAKRSADYAAAKGAARTTITKRAQNEGANAAKVLIGGAIATAAASAVGVAGFLGFNFVGKTVEQQGKILTAVEYAVAAIAVVGAAYVAYRYVRRR